MAGVGLGDLRCPFQPDHSVLLVCNTRFKNRGKKKGWSHSAVGSPFTKGLKKALHVLSSAELSGSVCLKEARMEVDALHHPIVPIRPRHAARLLTVVHR